MSREYQYASGFETFRLDKEIERRVEEQYAQLFIDACGAKKHSVDLSPLRLRRRVDSVIHAFADSTRRFPLQKTDRPRTELE